MSKLAESFYQQFHNHTCESSPYETAEFKSIATKFKNALTKMLEATGAKLLSFEKGHFECSGFIKRQDGQLYYFSSNDFRSPNPLDRLLYRTAGHLKDYRGGRNQFCNFLELAQKIEQD